MKYLQEELEIKYVKVSMWLLGGGDSGLARPGWLEQGLPPRLLFSQLTTLEHEYLPTSS